MQPTQVKVNLHVTLTPPQINYSSLGIHGELVPGNAPPIPKSAESQIPYIKWYRKHTVGPQHPWIPNPGSQILFSIQLVDSTDAKSGDRDPTVNLLKNIRVLSGPVQIKPMLHMVQL